MPNSLDPTRERGVHFYTFARNALNLNGGDYTWHEHFEIAAAHQHNIERVNIVQIIAQAKNAAGRTVVIAQSASQSGGRRYGHFVNLRVVALPVGMTADGYRSLSQRGVEVLCDLGEADARSTGPKSRYAMRLERAWAAFGEVVGEAVASHARACNAVNVLLSDLRRLEAYKRFDDVLYTQYIADLQPRLNSAREKLAAAEAALAA